MAMLRRTVADCTTLLAQLEVAETTARLG